MKHFMKIKNCVGDTFPNFFFFFFFFFQKTHLEKITKMKNVKKTKFVLFDRYWLV